MLFLCCLCSQIVIFVSIEMWTGYRVIETVLLDVSTVALPLNERHGPIRYKRLPPYGYGVHPTHVASGAHRRLYEHSFWEYVERGAR
jgi:hypothetical protein